MGRTACTEPQCLYKSVLYFNHYSVNYPENTGVFIQHSEVKQVSLRTLQNQQALFDILQNRPLQNLHIISGTTFKTVFLAAKN
jgi:hypothetical protein